MTHRNTISFCSATLLALTGCTGYTWVKKSDLAKIPKVVVDSSEIMSLRQQLTDMSERMRSDSARYATLLAERPTGVPDSVVKARDAEIASLKDQLAKALSELDRIKRRLATPRT
jgi:hypothetical protein